MTASIIDEAMTRQPALSRHFMAVIDHHQLAHAYLFAGNNATETQAVATLIALRLFCLNVSADGVPCGTCEACLRILAGEHPDVVTAGPEGQSIRVDAVRRLKAEFSKSAVEGDQKVFIVTDIDKMTTSAANSLLKFIEEPAGQVVALLLTTNKQLILPTILSRTQVVEFPDVAAKVFSQQLADAGVNHQQRYLVQCLTTSVTTAEQLMADDWLPSVQKQVGQWFAHVAQGDYQAFVEVQTGILPLITSKEQQGWLLDVVVQAFHDVLRQQVMTVAPDELAFPTNQSASQDLAQRSTTDQLVVLLEAALATRRQLAGNMNFQTTLEALTLQLLSGVNAAG